jgi:hypothetical protein
MAASTRAHQKAIAQLATARIRRCCQCNSVMQIDKYGHMPPEHATPEGRHCYALAYNHAPATPQEIHDYLWRSK